MTITSVAQWSTDQAQNTDIAGNNIDEGCSPAGINNAIRYMMAQIAATAIAEFGTVALLIADTTKTYSNTTAGAYIRTRAEGFAYEVAAFDAADHHVTTGGGLKLYVLPDADGYVSAKQLGYTTSLNGLSALIAASLIGHRLRFENQTYTATEAVELSALSGASFGPNTIFDFTSASSAASFPDGGFVTIIGDALVALPDLAADVDNGDTDLTFASAPTLSVGDIICIYNPTDYSESDWRAEYKAGEFCTVAEVSGTAVGVFGGLYETYLAADVELYKHPKKTFTIGGGKLTILEATASAFNSTAGFKASRVYGADFHRIRPTNSGYAGMVLDQCVGLCGDGYDLMQMRHTSGGTYYGVVWSNSQNCKVTGRFYGGRHASTTGGNTGTGAVPCRGIDVRGVFENAPDAAAGIGAVNWHGNSFHCTYGGIIKGGVSGGGNWNTIVPGSRILPHNNQTGIAVYFGELCGVDFDLRNTFIKANGSPAPFGVIDLGGNTTVLGANTTRGGTLLLDGMVIDAPDTTRFVVARNRGYVGTETINVSMRNMIIKPTAGASPIVALVNTVSGNTWDRLMLDGLVNNAAASYSTTATKINGWKASGKTALTPVAGATIAEATVSFIAPRTPVVVACCEDHLLGNVQWIAMARAASTTGVTLRGTTVPSGTVTFANTTAGDVSWIAMVEE